MNHIPKSSPLSLVGRVQSKLRRVASARLAQRSVPIRPTRPLVSFTFDDFPKSAWRTAGAILNQRECKGTYYTSLGLMDQAIPAGTAFSLNDLQEVVDAEHELGCHTFHHCHAWDTEPSVFERSMDENREALKRLIPSARFESLAYPISLPRPGTKRRAARHFPFCRGGGDSFCRGQLDANSLPAVFLEKLNEDLGAVQRLVTANVEQSGWLIFATHDVCDRPTRFGCSSAFFRNVVDLVLDSGSTVLPAASAWSELVSTEAQNG